MDTEPPTVVVKTFNEVLIGDKLPFPSRAYVLDKYTHGDFDDPNAAIQIYLSDGNTVNGIGSTTLTVLT